MWAGRAEGAVTGSSVSGIAGAQVFNVSGWLGGAAFSSARSLMNPVPPPALPERGALLLAGDDSREPGAWVGAEPRQGALLQVGIPGREGFASEGGWHS